MSIQHAQLAERLVIARDSLQVVHRHQLELQADAVDKVRAQLHMQQQQQQAAAELQQVAGDAVSPGQQQGSQHLSVDALAQQLEKSQQELRAALAAAADAQQEARQLRRQLSTR